MHILFATSNQHKFEEARSILAPFGITLEQFDAGYPEEQEKDLESIAAGGAKLLAEEAGEPVITEDTGIFFEAYPGFPGPLAKFLIQSVGPEGVFRLLTDTSRAAYFETVAAFCMPGMAPVAYHGFLRGEITTEVHNAEAEGMQYDKIFIPEGEKRTISDMTMEEKNAISQRAEAFRKLGKHIQKHY